jgi:hypothetical protein
MNFVRYREYCMDKLVNVVFVQNARIPGNLETRFLYFYLPRCLELFLGFLHTCKLNSQPVEGWALIAGWHFALFSIHWLSHLCTVRLAENPFHTRVIGSELQNYLEIANFVCIHTACLFCLAICYTLISC